MNTFEKGAGLPLPWIFIFLKTNASDEKTNQLFIYLFSVCVRRALLSFVLRICLEFIYTYIYICIS